MENQWLPTSMLIELWSIHSLVDHRVFLTWQQLEHFRVILISLRIRQKWATPAGCAATMSGGDKTVTIQDLARKSDPKEFLQAIFDGLICDDFRFLKNSSFHGDNCISAPFVISVPPHCAGKPAFGPGSVKVHADDPKLSLHLNFVCTHSLSQDRLTLRIKHFHITARAVKDQDLIDAHGPSSLTAALAVHLNRNTDWGREDEIDALAVKIAPATRADMLYVLNQHFTTKSLSHGLVEQWRKKIHDTAARNLGKLVPPGNISFHGSDKTFS